MAFSMNHFVGIGFVGGDPETRRTNNGEVINFSVGITDQFSGGRDRDRETTWFRCFTFNEKLIDVIDKYVRKGDPVGFTGKLSLREWEGDDGKTRSSLECMVFDVQLLTRASDDDRGGDRRDGRQRDSRGGDRGSDRGGERGRDRDDRGRGGDRDDRGRDTRSASGGRDRDDDRGRDGGRGSSRSTQADRDLDDEIPFA